MQRRDGRAGAAGEEPIDALVVGDSAELADGLKLPASAKWVRRTWRTMTMATRTEATMARSDVLVRRSRASGIRAMMTAARTRTRRRHWRPMRAEPGLSSVRWSAPIRARQTTAVAIPPHSNQRARWASQLGQSTATHLYGLGRLHHLRHRGRSEDQRGREREVKQLERRAGKGIATQAVQESSGQVSMAIGRLERTESRQRRTEPRRG